MGGSSSKQEVQSKQVKNFMKDEVLQEEAKQLGQDPTLYAYQHQKFAKEVEADTLKQRTIDEKQHDLVDQEAALQERIDKAKLDLEFA